MNVNVLIEIRSLPLLQTLVRTSGLHGFVLYSTLHLVTSEALTGWKGIPGRGLLRNTLNNVAKCYSFQGGLYPDEGCMALRYW